MREHLEQIIDHMEFNKGPEYTVVNSGLDALMIRADTAINQVEVVLKRNADFAAAAVTYEDRFTVGVTDRKLRTNERSLGQETDMNAFLADITWGIPHMGRVLTERRDAVVNFRPT